MIEVEKSFRILTCPGSQWKQSGCRYTDSLLDVEQVCPLCDQKIQEHAGVTFVPDAVGGFSAEGEGPIREYFMLVGSSDDVGGDEGLAWRVLRFMEEDRRCSRASIMAFEAAIDYVVSRETAIKLLTHTSNAVQSAGHSVEPYGSWRRLEAACGVLRDMGYQAGTTRVLAEQDGIGFTFPGFEVLALQGAFVLILTPVIQQLIRDMGGGLDRVAIPGRALDGTPVGDLRELLQSVLDESMNYSPRHYVEQAGPAGPNRLKLLDQLGHLLDSVFKNGKLQDWRLVDMEVRIWTGEPGYGDSQVVWTGHPGLAARHLALGDIEGCAELEITIAPDRTAGRGERALLALRQWAEDGLTSRRLHERGKNLWAAIAALGIAEPTGSCAHEALPRFPPPGQHLEVSSNRVDGEMTGVDVVADRRVGLDHFPIRYAPASCRGADPCMAELCPRCLGGPDDAGGHDAFSYALETLLECRLGRPEHLQNKIDTAMTALRNKGRIVRARR